MLFALGQPAALVGLFLGFLVGVVVVGLVQARLTRSSGPRYTGVAAIGRHVDPFGAVAAALGGVGWASPAEVGKFRRGPARSRAIMTLLAAPLTHAALAFVAFGVLAVMGKLGALALANDTRLVLHGVYEGPFLELTIFGFAVVNLTMALLHVIPLPPMAAGRILLMLAPQTPAWQRASYQLEDNNWGIGIMLFLSLPLFSSFALSASLTAALARPILSALSGAG